MSFDKDTRNLLAKTVAACRRRLVEDVTDQLRGMFGLHPDGTVLPLEKLTYLSPDQHAVARRLRDLLYHYVIGAVEKDSDRRKAAYERMVLEISFTVLNRLAALRLCEERGLVVECIRNGTASDGFQMLERISGGALGGRYETYRVFLECLFDELALDLGVLFDRMTPQSAVFPSERCLEDVLAELNKTELAHLWTEDETIGWIYQYFYSDDDRKSAGRGSRPPQNSYELAVRNQFFTPRYVVEFLTDNTLGRIWYEARKGDTILKEECRYLVQRPAEVFLGPGEKVQAGKDDEGDLSQEELLKQMVYIEHRPKKDPRDLRILDPACGSGHFLLYAFDLLERIYEETWSDPESPKSEATGWSIQEDFKTIDDLRREVPKLVVEHNLHGIDIDPRAVQIAALALWLRAQKNWKNLGLKAPERPRIARSNIVTAEPMPGEEDMRREFTASLKPRVLGQIVDEVFEKMKLAGEAGSLLKIEEEIKDAVAAAGKQWREGPKPEQELLFLTIDAPRPKQQEPRFDVKGITDERFWEQAEDRILDALKNYAERAEDGHAIRRRLFVEDAARGFAFIDLCRKRYDVVLMNPPFGEVAGVTIRFVESTYPLYAKNILCAFIERSQELLLACGTAGSVVDRTILIKNSYEKFRRGRLLENGALANVADLGWGVLDANVEVSSVVVKSKCCYNSEVYGADVTRVGNKDSELINQLVSPIILSHETLESQPFAAISFQMPEFLRNALRSAPSLGDVGVAFYNGHTIKSDVFKRLIWEISSKCLMGQAVRMWNGSEYSPFYVPFQECVLIRDYAGGMEAHRSTILRNPTKHLSAGLCYGKRGEYLDVQILPKGFILTNEGFGGPRRKDEITWFSLAILNSLPAQLAINFYCGQHKGVGYVNALPLPGHATVLSKQMVELAKATYGELRNVGRSLETDPFFLTPFCTNSCERMLSAQDWVRNYSAINERVLDAIKKMDGIAVELFSIDETEKKALFESAADRPTPTVIGGVNCTVDESIKSFWAQAMVSFFVGVILGRWDVRIALDPSLVPKLPDPFDPLPVCPPGMLAGPDGLPAEANRIVSEEWLRARPDANTLPPEGSVKTPTILDSDYPLRISWDGVLVDDNGFNGDRPHRDDIVRRIREIFDLIWKDKAQEIEQEACDILGVSDLRDYFRRPAGFFQDHLKRYSKSRRKAPVYWPLSTTSGSYTIWLYYHRLNDQTLYGAVNKYVEPKISEVERGIAQIEDNLKAASGREATRLTDRLNEARTFVGELRDLREELLRIAALPYKPDLNDGVIVNAAPFHGLFRLRSWAKDTEDCWKKLAKGDYDWAHLAYTIWPDRIREVCLTDRSIAIAHGLEDLYEIEAAESHKKGGRGRRKKGAAR
ncbi:MAG: N-6 DNA Methylase [Syntrophorhabdus sp. PtaU1.Bin002]|nr:MAG: N-6 DNA Methylase [Syntrophorhabdus sp. PtaU1.Bin002]